MAEIGTTAGAGSRLQPGDQAQLFDPGVSVVQQTVADASVAPTDTPSADQVRVQRDGTRTFIWTFDTTDGWKGTEVTA